MTGPIILPATHPLPHAHRAEFAAWVADKLREARALGPVPPMFVLQADANSDEDRKQIDLALRRACPTPLTHVPVRIECVPPDDTPWPFSLLELKANLRP